MQSQIDFLAMDDKKASNDTIGEANSVVVQTNNTSTASDPNNGNESNLPEYIFLLMFVAMYIGALMTAVLDKKKDGQRKAAIRALIIFGVVICIVFPILNIIANKMENKKKERERKKQIQSGDLSAV
ncbi:hypothetical protein OROGR_014820 [Orobanche gracilis]